MFLPSSTHCGKARKRYFRIMRRELYALGQTINIRCLKLLLAIATQIAVAQIVRKDEMMLGLDRAAAAAEWLTTRTRMPRSG
jgi:hypothetical protein